MKGWGGAVPQVVRAEAHAHQEADWYLLTVTADLLAFVYVALFYQVPWSAGVRIDLSVCVMTA